MRFKHRPFHWPAMSGVMLMVVAACAPYESYPTSETQSTSLYQRLGGKPAIQAVVNDFVGRVGADSRIKARFATTNLPGFQAHLVNQICQASGGPCSYVGLGMKSAHAGMGITNAEFDALVGDLVTTLNKFKVGEREQSELLSVLSPHEERHRRGPIITIRKGGANDEKAGWDADWGDGVCPDSFRRNGIPWIVLL